jgi:hypothetical protein
MAWHFAAKQRQELQNVIKSAAFREKSRVCPLYFETARF